MQACFSLVNVVGISQKWLLQWLKLNTTLRFGTFEKNAPGKTSNDEFKINIANHAMTAANACASQAGWPSPSCKGVIFTACCL